MGRGGEGEEGHPPAGRAPCAGRGPQLPLTASGNELDRAEGGRAREGAGGSAYLVPSFQTEGDSCGGGGASLPYGASFDSLAFIANIGRQYGRQRIGDEGREMLSPIRRQRLARKLATELAIMAGPGESAVILKWSPIIGRQC